MLNACHLPCFFVEVSVVQIGHFIETPVPTSGFPQVGAVLILSCQKSVWNFLWLCVGFSAHILRPGVV